MMTLRALAWDRSAYGIATLMAVTKANHFGRCGTQQCQYLLGARAAWPLLFLQRFFSPEIL